jgi:predicted alpha/beta-fold hydrolase
MFTETVPGSEELSKFVDFLLTARGGHVGFISGATPVSTYSWSEKKIIEFLKEKTVDE